MGIILPYDDDDGDGDGDGDDDGDGDGDGGSPYYVVERSASKKTFSCKRKLAKMF